MWLWLWCVGVAWSGPLEDGDAAFEAGDHPAALIWWGEALQEVRATGEEQAEVPVLMRMAAAQRELGAVDLASKSLGRANKLAGPDHRADLALSRGRLALHVGDLEEAERSFRAAYRAHREAERPRGAANAALNLGVARLQRGDSPGAREAFEGARTLFHALGDVRGEADSWVDLALVDRREEDLRGARTRLEHALELYEREKDDAGTIDARVNLAAVASALARPEEARTHLEAGLQRARARKDLPRQAAILHQLAALAWGAGDATRAIERLEVAEQAYVEVGRTRDALVVALDAALLAPPADPAGLVERADDLKDARLQARALVLAARTALERSDADATGHARKALRLAERLELTTVQWQALYVLGEQARRSGDLEEAAERLGAAVDLLDTERRLLPREHAESFVAGHEPVYRALADVHLARGEAMAALATAERLSLSELPISEAAEPAAELAQREAWLRQRLGTEVAERGDTARAKALRSRLAEVRVAFASQVDQLRTNVDDFDARVRVAPEDLEALQGELAPGVAVVQPILLPDRLVLLVFTRESLRAVPVEVAPDELEASLRRLTRALRAGLRDRAVLDPLAARLGGWLWAPIAEDLAGAKTVVVSAAGELRQLPFALLRHEDRYLAEQSAVVTITHVGSLRGASSPMRVEGRGLLLVGNPDGTLPGATEEVRSLAARFSGSEVLIGEDATRAALLARMGGRTTVHLATHGRIDPDQPAHSYLVLAPDDSGETRLGYREIPGLAPFLGEARMVVLSACESGRPVEARGGDGVVSIQGLAAQFRRAGVETLVASLWKVDDAGTKALMEAFYAQLDEGHDAAAALAEAQRSLMKDPDHGSPWVWAAFVIAGDWR